ncbi:cytochrome P450 [Cylindrobasidium torrendii FP15055 ss-10]|uniref:Cytochrome P450 n=1 Tax=Cylindrobasidium torrendii FP15055 ss-10 TaxID=1314674 RepID=A0A0D7AVE7_9AGAR|nr:cytochrome P450 [Cylindrobasidium torrendii FP15055 ss-10]
MFYSGILLALVTLVFVHRIFGVGLRRKQSRLCGPPNESWLLGHEARMQFQLSAGKLEQEWTNEYGTAVRISSFAGQSGLLLSDPKGLQYVFNEKPYQYPKGGDNVMFTAALMGRGLGVVTGQEHQRQRRVLNVAFAPSMVPGWAVIFQDRAEKMIEMIRTQKETTTSTNIIEWSTKFAMDVLGLTAFRHDFGALAGTDVPHNRELSNAFNTASTRLIFVDLILAMAAIRLPSWIIPFLTRVPTPIQQALRRYKDFSYRAAAEVMHGALTDPKERQDKDVLGLLATAYHSEDPSQKLQMDEVLAQMSTFLLAGQETVANSLGFLMYELATHPDDQQQVREEVQALYAKKAGNTHLEPRDYDSLPYLNAVIKECLRMHPIAHTLPRRVTEDDALPLSEPVTLEDGTQATSVPVQKGDRILCSFLAYNRLPSVWGPDASKWNPRRFLDGREINSNAGMFGNLMSFSAGARGCIGWRFAVLEMQVATALMVKNFELSPVPDVKVKMVPSQFLMIPAVDGKEGEGAQVPLILKNID